MDRDDALKKAARHERKAKKAERAANTPEQERQDNKARRWLKRAKAL